MAYIFLRAHGQRVAHVGERPLEVEPPGAVARDRGVLRRDTVGGLRSEERRVGKECAR